MTQRPRHWEEEPCQRIKEGGRGPQLQRSSSQTKLGSSVLNSEASGPVVVGLRYLGTYGQVPSITLPAFATWRLLNADSCDARR